MKYVAITFVAVSLTTFLIYRLANGVLGLNLRLKSLVFCAGCAMFVSILLPRVVVSFAGLTGTLFFLALFAVLFAYYLAYYERSADSECKDEGIGQHSVPVIVGATQDLCLQNIPSQEYCPTKATETKPSLLSLVEETTADIKEAILINIPDNSQIEENTAANIENTIATPDENDANTHDANTHDANTHDDITADASDDTPSVTENILEFKVTDAPLTQAEEIPPPIADDVLTIISNEKPDITESINVPEDIPETVLDENPLSCTDELQETISNEAPMVDTDDDTTILTDLEINTENDLNKLQINDSIDLSETLNSLIEDIHETVPDAITSTAQEEFQIADPNTNTPTIIDAPCEKDDDTKIVLDDNPTTPIEAVVENHEDAIVLHDEVQIAVTAEEAPTITVLGDFASALAENNNTSTEEEAIEVTATETIVENMLVINDNDTPVSDSLDDLLDFAFLKKEKQEYAMALQALRQALKIYPESDAAPFLVVEIGNILKNKGAYDEAIGIFTTNRNLPGVSKDLFLQQEFTSTIAYLRIIRNTLLEHRIGFVPFSDIPPEVLKEIDTAFREWRDVATD